MKLVLKERESEALRRSLPAVGELVVSRLAIVEVLRAAARADPAPETRADAERVLGTCRLVEVSDAVLRAAANLAAPTLRALDAIHVATALRVGARELVGYDRRLLEAARAQGLAVSAPGASS